MEGTYRIHSGMTLEEMDRVNEQMNADFAKHTANIKEGFDALSKGIEQQQREWKEINEELKKKNASGMIPAIRDLADATCGFFLESPPLSWMMKL